MKKSWIRFLLIVLLLLLPLVAVLASGFFTPTQFERTFLGEFDDKVERLRNTDGAKIIVIGGSSAAFGVDAELLEKTLGMPVVNFGLYATLGTKTMLDYSKSGIGEGDIIVIAPEMNAQTWSLYFNAEAMWQAVDGHFSLLRYLDSDDIPAMLGGFWRFASSKLQYMREGTGLDPDGIYNASSFDDYGFIRYNRTKDYNTMAGGYDSGMIIDFNLEMISEDFIDYVNDYVKYAQKKGATVYLGFCPMNEMAIDPDTTLETLEAFTDFLSERFDCEVLGDPNEYLYRSGYFFDSNFHTNSAGAVLHTRQLAIDLAAKMGEITVDIEVPDEPEIPDNPDEPDVYEYDENEVYFTYNVTDFGVYITGVTELGKTQTTLRTPVAYDGKKVVAFTADTFAGCGTLAELFVTDNIGQIPDGTFRGAESLEKIHILAVDPDKCTVNNVSGGAREGLPERSRFYVPEESYANFVTNYFWGPYANYIVAE